MAASAPSFISTNPKPRLRPVSRSMTTCDDFTLPYCANRSRRSSLVVPKGRLPTYKFLLMCIHLRAVRLLTKTHQNQNGPEDPGRFKQRAGWHAVGAFNFGQRPFAKVAFLLSTPA